MAYVPNSGSVVAFQSDPTKLVGTMSVIGALSPSSVWAVNTQFGSSVIGHAPVVIVGGSILTSSTANQSVSGEVSVSNFPVNQNVSGSVVAFQGTPEWTVKSSLAGGIFPISGSVSATLTNTNVNVGGSVVSYQGTSPWIVAPNNSSVITISSGSVATVIIGGSIAASFTPPANQSVSGTVQTDVNSSVAVVIIGGSIAASFTPPANQSVSGEVSVSNFPTNQNVSGSVVAFQGTAEWTVKSSITGGIFPVSGSVAATITNTNLNVGGSVAAWLQSTNASVITVGTAAPNQSVSGEVSISNFPVNQNVSGSVVTFEAGTRMTSIVSTVPSSVIVGASIFGLPPVNVTNTNLNVGGSVVAFQGAGWSGSVAATITNTNVNVSGSVVAHQGTNPWVVQSIVGTYAEDASHTTADKGLFILAVRNDAVASFVSANLEYSANASDSAGRPLVKPFAAEEARVEGYHSVVSTSVTTLIAAAGAGLRNYVTDVWVVNSGASDSLITFKDGAGSILGYTIAPSGGGSNLIGLQTPIRTGANATFDFQPTTASSIIYATAKGFKAP